MSGATGSMGQDQLEQRTETTVRQTTRGLRLSALRRAVVVQVTVTIGGSVIDRGLVSRPSQEVRVAAARVRVNSDRQVHRPTPQWIKDLANSDSRDESVELPRGHKRGAGWIGWSRCP
ncbi:hypothetical protein GCM10027057_25760 [Marisediminicola antarctica]|uniref:Uncharacterized protein n=1 Tax=Marisediminicola antarctica TaxID=674079 RepID=A0A7L5AKM5_9MICO|nr:hypothetical protein BHD05_12500 [Marisediminicola antarctica]